MNNPFAYTTQNIYARLKLLSSCTKIITRSQTNPPSYPIWLPFYSMYLNPLSIYSPTPTEISIFWYNFANQTHKSQLQAMTKEIKARIQQLKSENKSALLGRTAK